MSRRVHILEGTTSDGAKVLACGRTVNGVVRCIGSALVLDAATRREVTCALCLSRFRPRTNPPEALEKKA